MPDLDLIKQGEQDTGRVRRYRIFDHLKTPPSLRAPGSARCAARGQAPRSNLEPPGLVRSRLLVRQEKLARFSRWKTGAGKP